METAAKWVFVLVAFDDPELEPAVLKERIGAGEDEQLAALLRGGEIIDVMEDDEEWIAEACRIELEKKCLR